MTIALAAPLSEVFCMVPSCEGQQYHGPSSDVKCPVWPWDHTELAAVLSVLYNFLGVKASSSIDPGAIASVLHDCML
jgi:hypothetical protein